MKIKDSYFGWRLSSLILGGALASPIVAIFYMAMGETNDLFAHLMSTVMLTYMSNTILLAVGVIGFSLLFGLPCAWLMSMCQLPSERILQWVLVLPLAMPGYIVGYIFTDWFDYAGPIQVWLRETTDLAGGEYWFPEIRTVGGASFILGLVLYPYVYLMCKAAFMEQSVSLLQSARLLKCSVWRSFFRVSIPLARPAIAVGLSLVAMEAIGDFGTVSYFAVNTLTTAVYDTWLGYSNLDAAAKISVMMLFMIFLILSSERYSRRKQKLFQTQFSSYEDIRYVLTGWQKWGAFIWCWGLVFIAFILPVMQLLVYSWQYFSHSWTDEFQTYATNSFKVAVIAAFIAVLIALVLNFNVRLTTSRRGVMVMRCASLGYAVPGTVLAIGVMIPLLFLDHLINDLVTWIGWQRPGLIFSGSMVALIIALLVRFTAIAIGSIENSLSKISPSLDMASRTMGCTPHQMLVRVHFPMIRRGCLIAGLLVFLESMKELNAALLLRPFNFETLATYVYNYASMEQLELAALPALLLILVGLIPLILINRSLECAH